MYKKRIAKTEMLIIIIIIIIIIINYRRIH